MAGRAGELGPLMGRRSALATRGRSLLALAAFAPTILRLGWREPLIDNETGLFVQMIALALYAAALGAPAILAPAGGRRFALLESKRAEVTLVGAALLTGWAAWPLMTSLTTALILVHVMKLYLDLVQTSVPPGLIFVGSFLIFSIVGTGALMLPAATPEDSPPITLLEASFTIVSAISQTGLILRDTGSEFTRFGQTIILIWIQVGALGVIVFGALLATFLGANFGLRAQQTIAEDTEQGWTGQLSLARLVTFTILLTLVLELVGAAALFFGWPEEWPGGPEVNTIGDRAFHAVFFSVSAFCNAGFSTAPNSLEGLRTHWIPHLVIAPLIVIGSIGFPVLDNIRQTVIAKLRGRRLMDGRLIRLNLNTKIILSATLAVYLLGYVLILIGERTQADIPMGLALLDAHFMNINRTSGFNTIPPDEMGLLSQLTLILLMFIGGSPGSVAGGIKMMVFAVLVLTVWSTIMGRRQTEVFGRTLHDAIVRKSATLITLSLAGVMTVTGVLAATETVEGEHTLDELLFEATSAFATCGLSLGITDEVSDAGKVALMVAMFVGRVGPLAVLAGLLSITRRSKTRYAYATEEVVIY
jgi:trk system potassium uptake protein TrkH